jgi:hypothetical protein
VTVIFTLFFADTLFQHVLVRKYQYEADPFEVLNAELQSTYFSTEGPPHIKSNAEAAGKSA